MIQQEKFKEILAKYKADEDSVYNTWFTDGEQRLKAFRAIRRGVEQVVQDIRNGTFGNDFKGSSLEVVLTAITEQKQVFEGAAHPFYWKPKLRIPDIYENEQNKRIFGQFLESCLNTNSEDRIIREILTLSQQGIKGLGPAVANILYFIHPTIVPPSNTAMMRGFNMLLKGAKKLGSWEDYLEVREALVQVNDQFRDQLSKDLGAVSGLLFDVGSMNIVVDENVQLVIESERKKVEAARRKRHQEALAEGEEENTHTKMQYFLVKIGKSLGYDVVVAANDRSKSHENEKLSFLCLPGLPAMDVKPDVLKTIGLIDVLWFEKGTGRIVCAFEVEKSTSIFSGILRLTDLALTSPEVKTLYIAAPDAREKEVIAQLKRPSISTGKGVNMSYLLFSDLREHCESICKFGNDHTILEKIAKKP